VNRIYVRVPANIAPIGTCDGEPYGEGEASCDNESHDVHIRRGGLADARVILCGKHLNQFLAEVVADAHEMLGVRNLQWAVQTATHSERGFRRPSWNYVVAPGVQEWPDRGRKILKAFADGASVTDFVPSPEDILATDYELV
jgi:hypothetical protein